MFRCGPLQCPAISLAQVLTGDLGAVGIVPLVDGFRLGLDRFGELGLQEVVQDDLGCLNELTRQFLECRCGEVRRCEKVAQELEMRCFESGGWIGLVRREWYCRRGSLHRQHA